MKFFLLFKKILPKISNFVKFWKFLGKIKIEEMRSGK